MWPKITFLGDLPRLLPGHTVHIYEEIYTEYIYVGKSEEEKEKKFFAGRFTRVIDHSFAKCYVVGFLSYL